MKKIKGVSLVESLIAIVIFSIMAVYGVPSFISWIDNQRVSTYANALSEHLAYARSEAIKRNTTVEVCARAAPGSLECGALSNWSNGWLVYYSNNSGDPVILRLQEALSSSSLIEFSSSSLGFNGLGMINNSTASFSLSSAYCSGNHGRNILISRVGISSQNKMSC